MSVAAGTRSVLLPGREFAMGEADFYADEAPVHRVRVDAFKIDRYPGHQRAVRSFRRRDRLSHGRGTAAEPRRLPGSSPG